MLTTMKNEDRFLPIPELRLIFLLAIFGFCIECMYAGYPLVRNYGRSEYGAGTQKLVDTAR